MVDLSDVAEMGRDCTDMLRSALEVVAEEDVGFCLVAAPRGAARASLDDVDMTELFEIFGPVMEAVQH